MNIKIFDNVDEINKEVSEKFVKLINNKHDAVLGLATGSSPVGVYEKLIEEYINNNITFKDIVTVNLDEYYGLDPKNLQSYRHFMNDNLFDKVDINLDNTHVPVGNNSHVEAIEEYEKVLSNNKIDLQILGIGSNGHIAFNEPGTPLDQRTHMIKLDEKTRIDNERFFTSLNEVPTHAITMGLANIIEAQEIVLIAIGEKKAHAIKEMIRGEITENLPASILQNHPNTTIYLDKEAAKYL